MHRVVPELIIEKYKAGLYRGEVSAVGMFLDLTGFSSMTDSLMQKGQHGAEVLTGLMHSVFDPLVETIFNYGGKIVSFAGDGVQALFPSEGGDEKQVSLQALAAAWMIQKKLMENPERQTVYGYFSFSVRIGLTTGDVAWGILRSADGEKATYYFRGNAVDDSAEAEHQARAGEIVMTQAMYEWIHDVVVTQPFKKYYLLEKFIGLLPEPTPGKFPPIDVNIAKLFMPEDVITQNIRGEFRQVVNLFMRFPDLSSEQLVKFTEIVFELREKYGGLVNRMDFGDKGCNMLVLWGAPVTHENDMGRAINFVMELKTRAEVPITAGVTYYIAHAGYLGSAMCEDYTCYGWGVNLASRFMMNAPDGNIWIDERVARRVKNRFELEHLGAQTFKGFAVDQNVYLLKGRKQQEVLYPGDFVGREYELPQLIDFFQPLWRGEFAGLVTVTGEAGVGKSRLIYELKLSFIYGAKHFLWALCRSDQILRYSFNPFRYWLLRQFDVNSETDDSIKKKKFDDKLNQLLSQIPDPELTDELDRLRSVLGSLLDLYWPDSFYEQLDAEARYNNTLNALIVLLKAESLIRPVILVVEDAHFLDEDSKEFLPRLKRALTAGTVQYPVAILVSSRPIGQDDFLNQDLVDQNIHLGALSTRALFDLAEIYLGGAAAPELIKLLEVRSDGNPYFAEQILMYLKEENLLEISGRGWMTSRRLQETSLPTDIRALLLARLDQLPRHVRELVQSASILGREFDSRILADILFDEQDITAILAEAERANIWSAINSTQYIFSHALLRDTAYSTQMRSRRMELHAMALTVMERIHREDIDHHYTELAYHAERAMLSRKAFRYLRGAGKVAADLFQNRQAIEYFTRALVFVPPEDMASQYDLLADRVELYSRMGKRDLQLKDLTALARWSENMQDKDRVAKTLMLKASYNLSIGDYSNAIDHAERAFLDAGYELAHSDLGFFSRVVWSTALLRLGRVAESMQRAQVTLEHTRRHDNRKEESRTLSMLGLIALEQNDPMGAKKYLVEALEIAHEINDLGLESRVLNNLALAEGSVNGNFVLARHYYEQSYKIGREIGDAGVEGMALVNLGFAAGMQGDFLSAQSYHEQALYLAREIGNRTNEAYSLINLSAVSGFQNDAQKALQYSQQAYELSKSISDRSGEAWAFLYMGHAYLLQSEFHLARNFYCQSIDIRNEMGQSSLAMEPMAGLVEADFHANKIESAMREAENILNYLSTGGNLDGTDEPLRIYYACYLVFKENQDPRSTQILQTAKNMLEERVSKFDDETARRQYIENLPWRLALYKAAQVLAK